MNHYEVAFTATAERTASSHLLQHYRDGRRQEDLCFALWRPSYGADRTTALIDRIILPQEGERLLHRNASFTPEYSARAVTAAYRNNAGLAFLHSHPRDGWQNMSYADAVAEKDVLRPPSGATGLPLVGLTAGADGYWSARFWHKGKHHADWCRKVRVIGPKAYRLHYNDRLDKPSPRREILRRTYDTWGAATQRDIARMHVGIVGLGSVGCIVAEAVARIGVRRITLIDPDRVEAHNLDRLLYGTVADVGALKVDLAKASLELHATADRPLITALPLPVQSRMAYRKALDCDLLFSCVDRPVARDVLNHIANGHLIPVIDCGIAVEPLNRYGKFSNAHWRAHIVTPYHECLRCNGQYSTSDVVMERDGSLDDPAYISNLPAGLTTAQNVFPFSLSVAGMATGLMLRYVLSPDWWPLIQQLDCQVHTGATTIINRQCHPNCVFPARRALGNAIHPPYLKGK